ncbi:MAG: hypothetical protein U1F11_06060 [Steroidobacteraceae bacterium]
MKGAAEFLAGLVVPLWSVIAALLGTGGVIIGVVVTAWNSRRQLRIQLEQQSEENRVARVMSLRREVYMEAAGAMARSLSSLLQLADSARDYQQATENFARDFAAIGKVHVVASAGTLDLAHGLHAQLGNAQAELALARIPIVARQQLLVAAGISPERHVQLVEEQARAKVDFAELVMGWSRRLAARVPPALVATARSSTCRSRSRRTGRPSSAAGEQTEASMRALLQRVRSDNP